MMTEADEQKRADKEHAQKEALKSFILSVLFFVLRLFFEKPDWAALSLSIVCLYCLLVAFVFILSCFVPRPNNTSNQFIFFFWIPMAAIIYPYNTARPYLQVIDKGLQKLKKN